MIIDDDVDADVCILSNCKVVDPKSKIKSLVSIESLVSIDRVKVWYLLKINISSQNKFCYIHGYRNLPSFNCRIVWVSTRSRSCRGRSTLTRP